MLPVQPVQTPCALLSHLCVPSLVEKKKRLSVPQFCVVSCRDVMKTNASSDLVFLSLS